MVLHRPPEQVAQPHGAPSASSPARTATHARVTASRSPVPVPFLPQGLCTACFLCPVHSAPCHAALPDIPPRLLLLLNVPEHTAPITRSRSFLPSKLRGGRFYTVWFTVTCPAQYLARKRYRKYLLLDRQMAGPFSEAGRERLSS